MTQDDFRLFHTALFIIINEQTNKTNKQRNKQTRVNKPTNIYIHLQTNKQTKQNKTNKQTQLTNKQLNYNQANK